MAVVTVAFSDLYDWLDNQPDNTADTPYELNITGLTVSDIRSSSEEDSLGQTIKKHPSKYVDLSATSIPNGVTSLSSAFEDCFSLVTAPVIPDSVTNMDYTFQSCTSLVNVSVIPDSVTDMYYTFYGCTSLINAPFIPNGITNMAFTFGNCTSLAYKPIIPNTIETAIDCYYGVPTPNWKGTQSQANSFRSTFFAQTTDSEIQIYNDDRITYKESIYNIDISTLSTYLAGLDPNTVSTAYKIYIRGLTTSNASDIKTALIANNTKYVNLGYTTIPSGTDWHFLFSGCSSLVVSPDVPSGVTNMSYTFTDCTSLVSAPVIPDSVTNMDSTFTECTSLVSAPVIPDSVTNMESTFFRCTSLVTAPVIPNGVTDMDYTFSDCTSLVNVPVIPDSVTYMRSTFWGCTSLRKIDEFNIPLNTLKNNPNFRNMFINCTSLEAIGHKVEYSDDWHLVYLDFDTNTVEGKIYSRDKTSVSIPQTVITKNTISLPLITDELMFSNLISIADLEDIIEGTAQQQGMLDTNYSWYGKLVIPPTGDNFIMFAKEPSKFKSNIDFGGGGAELEIVSTSKSFTPAKDKRIIVDTSGVTVTLNYGGTNGVVAEVFAMESCTLTYYTSSSATSSLSMTTCSKAVFVYYNGGWALNANYGTTNSVTVDNMQSVSSNAVAQAIKDLLKPQNQTWSNNHSYTIEKESENILICGNPANQGSAIYYIKGRHSTNQALVGYVMTVMRSGNQNYNVSVSGDTLTITGDYCVTSLIHIATVL